MTTLAERVEEAAETLEKALPGPPVTAVVLGSGLGGFADDLPGALSIPSERIPHYPAPTVHGHAGKLVFWESAGRPLLAIQGRRHYYESGDAAEVVFPVHLAARLGARTIVLTNAAGGVNRGFQPGDLMVITDQINLTGRRQPPAGGGQQIVPRVEYDPALVRSILGVAEGMGIGMKRGVYCGVTGPTYETAAEVEYIYRIGGDAVGMSTVLEAAAAGALGLRLGGISLITNYGTGIRPAKLSHDHVTSVALRAAGTFSTLLRSLLPLLP
jgi:purine-nucleoside phosphorylase